MGGKLRSSVLFLWIYFSSGVFAAYENTWNLYYEQPCCGSSGHGYKHHKGGWLFFFNIVKDPGGFLTPFNLWVVTKKDLEAGAFKF